MKTDLSKILSISGQSGLFRYVAQAKNGAVVESLATGRRSSFSARNKMTALSDVSIYTSDGEVKLRDVFLKMEQALGGGGTISAKSSPDDLKAFFAKALPEYDRDRFYVSHMKKVTDWFNCLREFASLDFTDPEAEAGESASDGDADSPETAETPEA